MKAIKIHGTTKKIQQVVKLSKQALREGAYRVASRLHAVVLSMEGKTAPQIGNILKVHRSKVSIWLRNWQQKGMDGVWRGIALDVRRLCPMANNKNLQTYWTAALWHMDSHRASGHVQWLPESLMKNFLFLITQLMFHVSFMNSSFPSNAPRRRWPKLTKHVNPDGFATNIPTLKKSQNRRSGIKTKFYQASSSEMFGDAPPPQNEETHFRPRSPYAAAKVYATG